MFEVMDANQEALNIAHADKEELENLWMQAKDELRLTKQVRQVDANSLVLTTLFSNDSIMYTHTIFTTY